MVPAKILVVEDETIVARDIQQSLTRLGYDVPTTATSGEEAIRKTKEIHPDLILMDIVLKGQMDGVETVQQINRQFDVPVIYLTAYADDATLERAKTTSPAGYMLKPFHPNELRPTIELALQRAQIDRHLKESLRWLSTTVRCMSDAMITTNRGGRLTYMSQAAQALTGWLQQDAMGAELTTLLTFEGDGPVQAFENPAMKAMMECRIIRLDRVTLRAKDGTIRPVAGSTSPVIDDAGVVIGSVIVFHDAQALEQPDRGFESIRSELRQAVARAPGVINLCAWCKQVPDTSGEWYDLDTFITEHSGLRFNGGLCPACLEKCFPHS
ncbi:MAG: putative sensory response regulator [Nitrospira sp.]|nr:MAG: putative sensory response regulator [Nitrospira sp.]